MIMHYASLYPELTLNHYEFTRVIFSVLNLYHYPDLPETSITDLSQTSLAFIRGIIDETRNGNNLSANNDSPSIDPLREFALKYDLVEEEFIGVWLNNHAIMEMEARVLSTLYPRAADLSSERYSQFKNEASHMLWDITRTGPMITLTPLGDSRLMQYELDAVVEPTNVMADYLEINDVSSRPPVPINKWRTGFTKPIET